MALKIKPDEWRLLQAGAKAGAFVHEQAKEYYSVNYKRLQRLEREGIFRKEPVVYEGKHTYQYKLTTEAKDLVREYLPHVKSFYKPALQGTTHDIALFEKYSNLTEYEQDIALTENQIKREFGECDDQGYASPPDMFVPAYKNSMGVMVEPKIIEVITRTYTEAHKRSKITYVREYIGISGYTEKDFITA